MTIKFGKGLWAKIPADGTTVVTKPVLKGQDEQGKNIWENQKTRVPNRELENQSLNTDCSSSGFRTSMILPVYRMIPSFSNFFISL